MKHIKIRPFIESKDALEFKWWLEDSTENGFDGFILDNDKLQVYCAFDDKKIAFLPVQNVAMLESLAVNPEASDSEVAAAMKEFTQAVSILARASGIKELYFLGSSPRTNEFAERHGFERINMPLFRMRLRDE